MSYRIVNLTTQEIVAEINEHDVAIAIAKQLAIEGDYKERWGVVEVVTIFETPLAPPEVEEEPD